MKRKELKIWSIEKIGEIETWQVEPWRYLEQRAIFERETGVSLPTLKGLRVIGKIDQLRILQRDVTIRVRLSDGRWYVWEFLAGWIWDLASVPWFFRSFVDNDNVYMQEAAIVHDSNYTGHFFGDDLPGLDSTNWLFREMIRFRKRRALAAVAHFAVNSIIGRALYWKKSSRAPETLKFVMFAQGRV